METDIKFNQLFESAPHKLYDLLHLQYPGNVTARSVEFKTARTSADLVLEPADRSEPARVIEFQGYRSKRFIPNVMLRCSLYRRRHPNRPVRCDIIYLDESCESTAVNDGGMFTPTVHYLPNLISEIEESNPDSPLVSIMRPVLHDSVDYITKHLEHDVQVLKQTPELDEGQRTDWLDILQYALMTRFNRSHQEILTMLYGYLPNVEDTIWGQELKEEWTAEAEQQGSKKGRLQQLQDEIHACQRRARIDLRSNPDIVVTRRHRGVVHQTRDQGDLVRAVGRVLRPGSAEVVRNGNLEYGLTLEHDVADPGTAELRI